MTNALANNIMANILKYVYQIITLHTLNVYSLVYIYLLYLNKAGEKRCCLSGNLHLLIISDFRKRKLAFSPLEPHLSTSIGRIIPGEGASLLHKCLGGNVYKGCSPLAASDSSGKPCTMGLLKCPPTL